jgi:hypothetical protein
MNDLKPPPGGFCYLRDAAPAVGHRFGRIDLKPLTVLHAADKASPYRRR